MMHWGKDHKRIFLIDEIYFFNIILFYYRYNHTYTYLISLREHEYKYYPILQTNSTTYVSNFRKHILDIIKK